MCPILHGEGLYAFLVPGPKRADLIRDARFAMHAFPTDHDEDAFSCAGTALVMDDGTLRDDVGRRFWDERPTLERFDLDDQLLFEFSLDRCLLTRTTGYGDPHPRHEIWRHEG
jgi:hypothetical protein